MRPNQPNFYPRSPRGERRKTKARPKPPPYFYPRSPRGERRQTELYWGESEIISIHAPREGSDRVFSRSVSWASSFLSTLPARGATGRSDRILPPYAHFYPRSPRGERPRLFVSRKGRISISIHAPREGSDARRPVHEPLGLISFHAPREGSDGFLRWKFRVSADFYPRPPRGDPPVYPTVPAQ